MLAGSAATSLRSRVQHFERRIKLIQLNAPRNDDAIKKLNRRIFELESAVRRLSRKVENPMTEQEQQTKVRQIADGVAGLVKWRNYLSWNCRLILSEALRDAADAIDYGAPRKIAASLDLCESDA